MKKTDEELIENLRNLASEQFESWVRSMLVEAADRIEEQSKALRLIAIECDPRGRQPVDKQKVFDMACESVVRAK